jgi:hypothetical protein
MPQKIRDKSGGIIYIPTKEENEKTLLINRIKKLEKQVKELLEWKDNFIKIKG